MNSQAGLVGPRFAPQEFVGHKKAGIAPCMITTPFVALRNSLEKMGSSEPNPYLLNRITQRDGLGWRIGLGRQPP
jgi:hypothetical protein